MAWISVHESIDGPKLRNLYMLEKVELVAPDCVNVSVTRATYEAEVREALKGYASRQPSGEEMHEMRSAFGAGTTVVDVLSGRRYAV